MSEDLKKDKKKIAEDWQNAFPQLTSYSQSKFYKKVGPIVIGIELIKLPRIEEYRPYFVIYPLWMNNVKMSIDIPIVLMEYRNRKGGQFSIPYGQHDIYFCEVVECVKKQSPLSFEENIPLATLFLIIDNYSAVPPLSHAPNSYLQAVLQESKLKIALYIDPNIAYDMFKYISGKTWDKNHFNACGIHLDKWVQDLQRVLDNRSDFLNQIETNQKDKSMMKLNSSLLTK